jgi:hypothetical protein
MHIEEWFFDPGEIESQLRKDVVGGLRMIATAIENGQMDAQVLQCAANGMNANWRDTRAHMLVTLDLAAEIRTPIDVPHGIGAGERKKLA